MVRLSLWMIRLTGFAGFGLVWPVTSDAQVEVFPVSQESIQASGPLCGIYALLGSARSLGNEVDPGSVIRSEFVGSRKGSTITELCEAAKAIGLHASPRKGLTVRSLKSSPCPLLLHLNRSRYQTTSRHWVLYLGDDHGYARIFDAPDTVRNTGYADLLAEWDGVAIQISSQKATMSKPGLPQRYSRQILVGVVIGLVLLVRSLNWLNFLSIALWMQAGFISLSIMLIGNAVHLVSPEGIHRNPSAVALVSRFHYTLSLPEISTRQLESLMARHLRDKSSELVIVDARPRSGFQLGHIPGAICIPVNSSPHQLAIAVENLKDARQVVVYCQSRGCEWDERIARHLVFSGIKNVHVYTGGWQEWIEEQLYESR